MKATMTGKVKTMPTSPFSVVLQHLLADRRPDGNGMTDGELLARFLRCRDEGALAALVRRHASMVWGVCRRLLNHHDAEDAFQATFPVLVRKAAKVPGQAVANWLYGVVRQMSVRVRATAAKRGRRETQVMNMPEPTVAEVRDADLQAVLDEELSRLPDHYRGVVVLCDLEGMTRKEAARQLGMPEGSVASRLARARVMLAKRLTRRGIVVSGVMLGAVLSRQSAWASVPTTVISCTIKAATLVATGRAVAGAISPTVSALYTGVTKAMFMTKIKSVLAMLLVAVLVGGTGLIYTTAAAQGDKKPTARKPMEPAAKQEKEKGAAKVAEEDHAKKEESSKLETGYLKVEAKGTLEVSEKIETDPKRLPQHSTGVNLRIGKEKYVELYFGSDKDMIDLARKLNGKNVVVNCDLMPVMEDAPFGIIPTIVRIAFKVTALKPVDAR